MLACVAATASAQEAPAVDPRIAVDTRELPRFKPVLLLSWEARTGRGELYAMGTGFLISPCHALTSKHFIADAIVGDRFIADRIRVEGGYVGAGAASKPTLETNARPIAWAGKSRAGRRSARRA